MENNMDIWNKVKTPPAAALKTITGGRLSGMTDIKPQWRYQVLTDVFGPCGVGWYYEISRRWLEEGSGNQIIAFVEINLYVKYPDEPPEEEWSKPIPGTGGSMLVVNEKAGPHTSDEAYKMATTDALSVAAKMIGVAADIYSGGKGGSKYDNQERPPAPTSGKKEFKKALSDGQRKKLWAMAKSKDVTDDESKEYIEWLMSLPEIETIEKDDKTTFTMTGASYVFDNFDGLFESWIQTKLEA